MYTLIEGVYYVVGLSPDGDSVKFKANNPALWATIDTDNRERFEKELEDDDGVVTIRLQAIDAPETHYSPPSLRTPRELRDKMSTAGVRKPRGGSHKQPKHLGDRATNIVLDYLGCTDVKWRRWGRNTWIDEAVIDGRKVEDKFQDAIPGYIITNDVERNGRPLGWVFAGPPPIADGSRLSREEVGQHIAASVNHRLLREGAVYPFFYMGLPGAIRIRLMEAAKQAQEDSAQDDLWLHDRTADGVQLPSLQNLYQDEVLYPYLFRRIVRHWHHSMLTRFWHGIEHGHAHNTLPTDDDLTLNLDGFFDEQDPWIFVVSQQDFLKLSEVMDVQGTSLQMHIYPYDIVFLS